MKIIKVNTKDINPAPYNPRVDLKSGDPDYEKLQRSIKEFGFVEPLVWNEQTGNLVGGHQRFKILQASEMRDPTIKGHSERVAAYSTGIALQMKMPEKDINDIQLAALLDELGKVPEFDVSLTGFAQSEINGLFDRYLTPNLDAIEDVPESEEPPVTKRGDLIHLGPHRLMCGDSTSPEDLKTLLQGQKINLWFTDFPYGVSYSSKQRPTNKRSKDKWLPIKNDDLKPEEYENFLRKSIQSLCPFLTNGAVGYFWNGFAKMGCLQNCLEAEGFHISSLLVWDKKIFSPSFGDFNWQSEFALYGFRKSTGRHFWYGGNSESNIWECSRDAANTLIHPTTKPTALAQRAMRNSSQRGNIVFDGFAGSGSTIVAAQSMERVCYAIEIELQYCDAIVRRYIKTFGRESVSPEVYQRYWKEV